VVAPFNRLDRLVERPADMALLDALAHDGTTWLAVGRLAPNKAHLALLDAFTIYLDRCDAHARLLVVGGEDPRLERYNAAIRERVSASNLAAHVRFMHDVRDDQLKAAYLRADAFVSLSAHEGFCVPLVEAMALGVPVVARAAGAQPWTLGGAGLAWDDADPALIAASVERLRADGMLRRALRERGFRRVADTFAPRVLEAQLLECLERLS
jgi:glycosyltransferase involved in cell wall biosynthesis